ncbi:MAG: sigma-70 family RNA polymerase sigma factor [Proteobacteria bacterium]|nr:sigma-70 family RNA polymerase sigma factor [Pseudomonadota bacterium]
MNAWGASDAELASAARAGSTDAFARLADRHQAALRAFLRRTCGDWAEADDLAQETLLTAWSQLARWRSDASFRAWLCGIGYRKQMTWRRGRARAARRDMQYLEAAAEVSPGAPAEDRIAVRDAMQTLPLDQRAAVALCLAADFSHAEAAQALGAPLGTIKSHVTRGRARLLQALGADDE